MYGCFSLMNSSSFFLLWSSSVCHLSVMRKAYNTTTVVCCCYPFCDKYDGIGVLLIVGVFLIVVIDDGWNSNCFNYHGTDGGFCCVNFLLIWLSEKLRTVPKFPTFWLNRLLSPISQKVENLGKVCNFLLDPISQSKSNWLIPTGRKLHTQDSNVLIKWTI